MPVRAVYRKGKKAGYRWGGHGKLYTCKEYGCEGAQDKAQKQGEAIYASGYKGK